jgi:hypothetical protein
MSKVVYSIKEHRLIGLRNNGTANVQRMYGNPAPYDMPYTLSTACPLIPTSHHTQAPSS